MRRPKVRITGAVIALKSRSKSSRTVMLRRLARIFVSTVLAFCWYCMPNESLVGIGREA